ncbi:MAG: hypothetical protein LC114_03410 [Bryobacterales bacterium]|nr:hypothetical protein [Bryobacterales bacterium]
MKRIGSSFPLIAVPLNALIGHARPGVSRSGAAGRARPSHVLKVMQSSVKAMRSLIIACAALMGSAMPLDVAAETIVCVPSAKTVQPCPGGYAPNQITIESTTSPDSYQSPFESMPAQEMILAVSIVFGGLLGFAVGVKLL